MQDKGLSAAQLASEFRAEWGEDLHWLLDSELVQQELVAQACVIGCPKLVASVAVATLAKLVGLGVDAAGTAMVTRASDKLTDALTRCRLGRLVLPRLHKVLTDARDNAEFRRRLRQVADGAIPPGEVEAPDAAPEELAVLLRLTRDLDDLGLRLDDLGTYLAGEFDTVNEKLDRLLDRAEPPRPRICTLPASTADFTGREAELARLADILAASGRANISAVTGMGGVGKTALAVEAAWRAAAGFPDGILFLDLGGFGPNPLTPEAALASLIAQVEPMPKAPEGLAQLGAAYRSLLANRRMLLLLDNARDQAQVRPLLPPEPVALLVTSRARMQLPGVARLHLDALPLPDAVKLLRGIIGDSADGAELEALAERCARLPIALRAAGTALQPPSSWTVGEYLAELTRARARLDHLSLPEPELDVRAVLQHSVDALQADDPALLGRWRSLTVFPADHDLPATAAVWGVAEAEARRGLDGLVGRSLLTLDPDSRRYRLHDLYRELAGTATDLPAVEAAALRHSQHYCVVLETANRRFLASGEGVGEGLRSYDLERPNIEAGQAWAARHLKEGDEPARLAYLYGCWAVIHELRLPARQRISWLEAAAEGCRQRHDRHGEGVAAGNLGLAWAALGEPRKAIEYHEQYLAIARDIGDRRGEGNALGSLGLAWAVLGEPRKAIEYHEQYLAIARDIGDRHGEGAALGNLGVAWAYLGEPRKAIELYEQHLAIARDIGDRCGEGNALGNLGLAWADLGEPRKAIELHEQRLAIDREIGDRRGEGAGLWNSALQYEKLGERDKAAANALAALAIRRQIEDPNAGKVETWLRKRGIDPDEP